MNLIEQIQAMNLIEQQREIVLGMVRDIRPLAIVDEERALLQLLTLFTSPEDGGRSQTIAAYALIELAKVGFAADLAVAAEVDVESTDPITAMTR